MTFYFLDTSALVKRYVQETGTAWLRNLTDSALGNALLIVRLTEVELTAAFARRRKGLTLDAGEARKALAQFRLEMVQDYRVIEITIPLLNRASHLADLHALRAYDAVQLAGALEVRSTIPTLKMISADGELNAAATAEGLTLDNPNEYP